MELLHLFTMMKTICGVKQGLWKCWFRLQNEIKTRWGDSKNEVGFDVYHIYEHVVIPKLENEVTHDEKVPKPEKRD